MRYFLFFSNIKCSVYRSIINTRSARHFYVLVAVWGLASAALAISGAYTSQTFYDLLPGLWIPFVPVQIFAIYFATSSSFRDTITKVIDQTPLHCLVYFQALRISAVGTARRTFPESFELFAGVLICFSDCRPYTSEGVPSKVALAAEVSQCGTY